MKKFLIFALLFLPVASFGAPSVRVLGTGGVTPGAGTKTTTSSAAKVTPAKATAAKPTAASTAQTATTSRIGTVRVKPKTTTTTTLSSGTTAATSSGSRFPVITPAHSYKTVGTQQAAGNTGSNTGTGTVRPAAVEDDPRFDMIRTYSSEADWRKKNAALVDQRLGEDYVFMWVEE